MKGPCLQKTSRWHGDVEYHDGKETEDHGRWQGSVDARSRNQGPYTRPMFVYWADCSIPDTGNLMKISCSCISMIWLRPAYDSNQTHGISGEGSMGGWIDS
jgi:hypothetical protein